MATCLRIRSHGLLRLQPVTTGFDWFLFATPATLHLWLHSAQQTSENIFFCHSGDHSLVHAALQLLFTIKGRDTSCSVNPLHLDTACGGHRYEELAVSEMARVTMKLL